jgi:hypothetical protein
MLLSISSNEAHMMAAQTIHPVFEEDPSAPWVQFKFDTEEYQQLKLVSFICGSLSIAAAVGVLMMYLHLLIYHPLDANRVSLHCVIFSIVLSLVDHCLNLAALNYGVHDTLCVSFRAADAVIPLISCCLLAMVGVHLLLVFNFHVRRWPCRPEYIYFPISIVYGVIGNIRGFISNDVPPNFRVIYADVPHDCW